MHISESNTAIIEKDKELQVRYEKIFKLETELNETKLSLNYIERDFKRQEDGLNLKMKEMDKMFKENEALREELA